MTNKLYVPISVKIILVILFLLGGTAESQAQFCRSDFAERQQQQKQIIAKQGGTHMRANAIVSLPGKCVKYMPDAATKWYLNSISDYTYDAEGRKVTEFTIQPFPNTYPRMDSTKYDGLGNIVETLSYSFNGGIWYLMNGTRTTYSFDSTGKETGKTESRWNYSSKTWINFLNKQTTYNAAGYPEETVYSGWSANVWHPNRKDVFVYSNPNNPPTEFYTMTYANGSWVNGNTKYADVTWYDFEKFQPSVFKTYKWNNNAWKLSSRNSITYDAYGGNIEILEDSTVNGNWENNSRWSTVYDSLRNYTGFIAESWLNNTWVFYHEDREALTYNGTGDIVERVISSTGASGQLLDLERYVYSNFRRITVGLKEDQALAVAIYPNPVQHTLHIQPDASEALDVQVTDLAGRVVLAQKLNAAPQHQLDLSALTPGMYLIRLEAKDGVKTTRIVKQ